MIAAFTRFDIINFATTQVRRVLLPLLFVIVFGLAVPAGGLPVLVGAAVAVASVSYLFQADERGLLDTLYATASVSRRDVVIGRYLTVILYAIVAAVLGIAVSLVGGVIDHHSFGWPVLATALLGAFVVIAIGVSAQLPFYFALGFTKARPLMFIPIVLVGGAGVVAIQLGVLKGIGGDIVSWTVNNPAIDAIGLAAGIALLVFSASIAVARYTRREL
jgi:hypothetical protein